jgi:ribosomal protein L11 methylase PrmA
LRGNHRLRVIIYTNRLITLLKSGGQLVLSGILHKQVEMILAAYGDYFSALKVTKIQH